MKERLNNKEWINLINQLVYFLHLNEELQPGQAYMNALHDIKPELYEEIIGTAYDCFYDDKNILNFISYLKGEE